MYSPPWFRAEALAQVGKPYILGAEAALTNDNPRAFDCSELVEWLFGRNRTPIGDLAAAQYDKTVAVSGSPRVGDLVFLRNNPARWNRIGHVAVITAPLANGDWEIVEARGRAAGVVKTTLSYWRTRAYFTGVRRFPGFKLASATPPPAPSADLAFRVGIANVAGYGRELDGMAIGTFLRERLRCSIYLLSETRNTTKDPARDEIRDALGGRDRWKVHVAPGGTCCAVWDAEKWEYGAKRDADFGDDFHGAVAVPLTAPSGHQVDAIATHSRPGAVATDEEKLDDVRKALDLAGSWPVIAGGDWATRRARGLAAADGFNIDTTPDVDTMDAAGDQRVDAGFARGLIVRGSRVVDPGGLSDHKWLVAKLSIPGRPSTL